MCTRNIVFSVVFIIVVQLLTSNAAHNNAKREEEKDSLEDKIKEKLNILKCAMKTGHPDSGIPILDPITISNKTLEYENKIIRVKCLLNNMSMGGLQKFNVEKLRVRLLPTQINYDLRVPYIKVVIDKYELSGKILKLLPLFGKGKIIIEIEDLHVYGYAAVSLKEKYLKLTEVYVRGGFDKFGFKITGLMKSVLISKVTSVVVTKLVPVVFKEHEEIIWDTIGSFALDVANNFLKNVTFRQAIDLLENEKFLPKALCNKKNI